MPKSLRSPRRTPEPRTERELLGTLPPRFRFELAAAQPPDANGKPSRVFKGLAAAYGNQFDRWSWEEGGLVTTVLEPGCFAESINLINTRGGIRQGNIPLMWEHYSPIGRTLSLEDAPEGVRISVRITDSPDFDRYVALIGDGTANGMSVGFNLIETSIRKSSETDGEPIEYVTKAELCEVTACLWGANSIPYIEAAASRVLGFHPREQLKGAMFSSANMADIDCIEGDVARMKARAAKEKKEEDDGEASADPPAEAAMSGALKELAVAVAKSAENPVQLVVDGRALGAPPPSEAAATPATSELAAALTEIATLRAELASRGSATASQLALAHARIDTLEALAGLRKE